MQSTDALSESNWSEWRSFPDPYRLGVLVAPFGPGCYELRDVTAGRKVLVGIANNVAWRMSSLLPSDRVGCGTRNNEGKRSYVADHLKSIEYRTCPCATIEEARRMERGCLDGGGYLFNT